MCTCCHSVLMHSRQADHTVHMQSSASVWLSSLRLLDHNYHSDRDAGMWWWCLSVCVCVCVFVCVCACVCVCVCVCVCYLAIVLLAVLDLLLQGVVACGRGPAVCQ